MVSLSCGKINDTVEPLLILQENFMKLLKKAFTFIFIFMLSVSGLTGYQVNASEEPKHLDILFTHDLHSHLNSFQTIVDGTQQETGGFARLKTLINEHEKENTDTLILDVLSEDYPEYKGFRKAYINAHILEVSGEEVSMEEGCLSLPGIHESVKRGNKIRVKYLDEDLVEHDEVVEGYLARVMQHEFDHLDGKMFIDHISPLRKQMIKGKLNAMLKGKARCSYKVKTIK